jgi:hypothetical protein
MISAAGAAPTANQAAEIELCPPPQDIKQLQRFLSMVNFYCHFLPKCAQVLCPLTDLLKGGAKTLQWTTSAQQAFQQNASSQWWYHSNIPPKQQKFLFSLTPPIPISEGSCNKNLETIAPPWFFLASSPIQKPLIPLLIASCWPLRQQSSNFVIFVKVVRSNFG